MNVSGIAALDQFSAAGTRSDGDVPEPETHSPPEFPAPPLRPESFSSVYSHSSSAPYSPSRAPVRRKPLPSGAAIPPPLPVGQGFPLESSTPAPPPLDPDPLRPPVRPTLFTALDSPTLPHVVEETVVARDLDRRDSHGYGWPGWSQHQPLGNGDITRKPLLQARGSYPPSPETPRSHERNSSQSTLAYSPRSRSHTPDQHTRSSSVSTMAVSPKVNHQSLSPGEVYASEPVEIQRPVSKSSNRFTGFFRWGSTSEQGGTGGSPATSPVNSKPPSILSTKGSIPPAIDIPLANSSQRGSDSGVDMRPITPTSMEEIEEEVRVVSADLAASIRREMELEDLVEQLQAEAAERSSGSSGGRRTSDYFSDAGTPVRLLDLETKPDYDVQKMLRQAEQEKAQVRLEMLGKVQDEREKRKLLEDKIAQNSLKITVPENPGRIAELEAAVQDAQRKLIEERQMKENFEDLLAALKEQLAAHRTERDSLRDEIVPRLRNRVENLESEASALQAISLEHSRMQQELMNLKNENASLAAAIQNRRRQSQAGSPSGYASPISPQATGISGAAVTPKDREGLEKRLKDVETQRDALHTALRSLRNRQEIESRKAAEKIKALEQERDKARHTPPGQQGKRNKEVSSLRREVDRLRKRADDALEQKFVCERSLGTLKMDLEKAEQETGTLRVLLQEHDDLIAQHSELQISHVRLSQQLSELKQERDSAPIEGEASSVSLQQAYKDLQSVHERSLARLDELQANTPSLTSPPEFEASNSARNSIASLRRSLTEAEIERDQAQAEAEGHRKRAESLAKSEQAHLAEERSLSMQLRLSSERIEEMAAQVSAQLASNDALRERLAAAIARGEEEQRASARRINDLQDRLRVLEDDVLEAQHAAEDAVSRHEEEIQRIRETHTSQLRRLKSSTLEVKTSPGSTPVVGPLLRSPRLEWTQKRFSQGNGANTAALEMRVEELEKALTDADEEMAEVVGRMNAAQIEVLELQSERDEAARQTRRLQSQMVEERNKYAAAQQS